MKSPLLLALVAVALLATGCSRKRYKMPSGSMWPTIGVGDAVLADTSRKSPARGDVFVFRFPEHPETSFVKRIVGLPGDRIETKGRTLLVNGVPLKRCVIGEASYRDDVAAPGAAGGDAALHPGELALEGEGYLVFHDAAVEPFDGAWTVAPDQFWAMGDNRANSHDSRMWNAGSGGGVPRDHLIGAVAVSAPALPKGAESLAPKLAACASELRR